MAHKFLRLDGVSYAYDAAEPLFQELNLGAIDGWTGIVGANGSGKTTLLRLAVGEITPSLGKVTHPDDVLYCDQRTDDRPEGFAEFLDSQAPEAYAIRGRLEIEADFLSRWTTLSHGERKRSQVAVALYRTPSLLAIDEPTNHLDMRACDLIREALAMYPGIGILVSHDRDLLDSLCHQCVFLDPPHAIVRPGSYSQGANQERLERDSLVRKRAEVEREIRKLRALANRRREDLEKGERQKSKRGLSKHDHDAKSKIDLARVTDSKDAARLRQLDGRIDHASARRNDLVVRREHRLGISLQGVQAPKARLFAEPATQIPLGPERNLHVPALTMDASDRIAIIGPNGSGKSRFVEQMYAKIDIPQSRVAYVPQEIDEQKSREILSRVKALPSDERGQVMNLVSRLGSRPERLLRSELPSPGEVRKLLLSFCVTSDPFLLLLDEPTNHLDLPSIECLEDALLGCKAALLFVSHDRRFVTKLAQGIWEIRRRETSRDDWILEPRTPTQSHVLDS